MDLAFICLVVSVIGLVVWNTILRYELRVNARELRDEKTINAFLEREMNDAKKETGEERKAHSKNSEKFKELVRNCLCKVAGDLETIVQDIDSHLASIEKE